MPLDFLPRIMDVDFPTRYLYSYPRHHSTNAANQICLYRRTRPTTLDDAHICI